MLHIMGSDPAKEYYDSALAKKALTGAAFVVVQDMFLTETAKLADVVLPAASAYEKNGTVTNVCGEVQKLKKALNTMGTKPDLEIMGLIGREMGLAKLLGPWFADQVFEEIRANGCPAWSHAGEIHAPWSDPSCCRRAPSSPPPARRTGPA